MQSINYNFDKCTILRSKYVTRVTEFLNLIQSIILSLGMADTIDLMIESGL